MDAKLKDEMAKLKDEMEIRLSHLQDYSVPMDGREIKLEDWNYFQVDPRRCQVFSLA